MSSVTVASDSPNDPPAMIASPPPHAPGQVPPLFSPDTAGEDRSGRGVTARFLAGLASHPQAGTPFLVALFGSAGSGKSALLRQVLDALRALGGSPGSTPSGGSDRPSIVGVRIDASTGADAQSTVVSRIFTALSLAYPSLAEEAVYIGGDPLKAARAAGERVNDLRRKLDSERQVLDELGGRQARLAETVLFESPGSRVDVYARANRGRIEARQRAFGVPGTDPIASYKSLVREAAEGGGGTSRVGLVLRALWGFKGQGTLIALAVLLLVIGWGSGDLAENQGAWMAWLSGFGDRFAGLSAWAQDRAGWLAPVSHAAYGLAFVAILVDIVRAIRFLHPILKGANLLTGDLDGRRRDLDSLLAHQTRRVDHVAAEADAAVRTAESAERRVETRRAAGLLEPTLSPAEGVLGTAASPHEAAEAFFAGLSAAMGGDAAKVAATAGVGSPGGTATSHNGPAEMTAAPNRIVVAIDELDRLSPAAAASFLETTHRLLGRPNFVTLAAVERSHILTGFADTDPALAAARLDRCVQLSYDLDAAAAMPESMTGQPGEDNRGVGANEIRHPTIDLPWQGFETQLVQALATFAGPNPRSTKRFVNSYRVARADPRLLDATPAELAALACALALDRSGVAAELGADRETAAPGEAVSPQNAHIARALAAAQQAIGSTFSPADVRRGLQVARIYSRRG